TELFDGIVPRLQPKADLPVLFASMCQLADFHRRQHKAFWNLADHMPTNHHKVGEQMIELVAQRDWAAFRERLYLDGSCLRGVLAVNQNVNALGVAGRGHDVPPHARQAIANVKQTDVADSLLIGYRLWDRHGNLSRENTSRLKNPCKPWRRGD